MSTAPPTVVDVTAESFAPDVIERSMQVPVLVDFWAPWCGPCKTLTPMLESLAEEYAGQFILAKVNIDDEAPLAQAFGIQSVPTVLLVSEGRQVDGFQGALPEQALRAFLERHVGAGADPLAEARAAHAAGDRGTAIAMTQQRLLQQPDDGDAQVFLAELLFEEGLLEQVQGILEQLPPVAAESAAAKALAAKLELGSASEGVDLEPLRSAVESDESSPGARLEYGRALAANGQYEAALEQLIQSVRLDKAFDDQAARKAMLEVFDALGTDNDLAVTYRKQLQMALFV
ncbi:MAG: thioredoxin [Planctomycetota bacterium]|jgi:putative thioredoxin